jgi:hypothetical protein
LVTTTLSLFGVYWLAANTETNVMGWYVNYVLPVGAILVGLVAASGYGAASWLTGVKINRGLLWSVLLLQLAAYFGAQYLEFRTLDLHYQDGSPVGFVEYFDDAARSFAWTQKDGSSGEALGAWGYAFRVLELVGFVGGGLIVPFGLRHKAYCDSCEVYMNKRDLGLLPAGVVPRKIKKGELQAQLNYEQELNEARTRGQVLLDAIAKNVTEGRVSEVRGILEAHAGRKKEYGKLTERIAVALTSCRRCGNGFVDTTLLSGQGEKVVRKEIGRHPVGPGFVNELIQGSRSAA